MDAHMEMDHSIFPVEKLSDGSYRIEVSLEIYSKEAVSATCYKYLNSYFVTQKEGKDPIYEPETLGVKNADTWKAIAARYKKKVS